MRKRDAKDNEKNYESLKGNKDQISFVCYQYKPRYVWSAINNENRQAIGQSWMEREYEIVVTIS